MSMYTALCACLNISMDGFLEEGFLHQRAYALVILIDAVKLPSPEAVPSYPPTNHAQGRLFLHSPSPTQFLFIFIPANPIGEHGISFDFILWFILS